MKCTSYGLTDIGCVRDSNQDSFLIHEKKGLYIVADGMGGHAAGELASSMAVKTIYDSYTGDDDPEMTVADLSQVTDEHVICERLRYAINRASQAIREESLRRPGCRGMGTTAVVLAIEGGTAYLAHAGDSRAYLIRPEGIRRLTRDHTWVADQMRAGLITESQAASSQFRNLLTRSVGQEMHVDSDCMSRRIQPDDRYLLCSDGLHGVVTDSEIYRVVRSRPPRQASEKLVEMARARGGPDNITVVIVSFATDSEPLDEEETTILDFE